MSTIFGLGRELCFEVLLSFRCLNLGIRLGSSRAAAINSLGLWLCRVVKVGAPPTLILMRVCEAEVGANYSIAVNFRRLRVDMSRRFPF